jgi:hypothetical protein
MIHSSFNKIVYSIVLIAIALLTSTCGGGPQAALHESWTLVQLLTQDERQESITETIDVRNCGVAEQKGIECSAGTSNNLSVSLGASVGVALGGKLTFDPSVANQLGFDRSSGESLQLETPAEGYVNRFVVTKNYRIISGQARARSSSGEERDGVYTFHASCSLRIEAVETLTCAEAQESTVPSAPGSLPTSTPASQEQIPPSETPSTEESTPSRTIPPGYVLYDDFTAPNALDTNWRLNDENQLCNLSVSEGQLLFDCRNETASDLGAALHPSQLSGGAMGLAATTSVEKAGGDFQLTTRWMCPDSGSERAYHIRLGTDSAEAIEFYPQEGWRKLVLGKVSVKLGQAHLLQIERTGNSIELFVDGQPLSLNPVPDLPACFSMSDSGFSFWVWKDGNSLKGQIDQVSVRY